MTWQLADGDFCHVEIPARDLARSRRSFEEVFGWQFIAIPEWETRNERRGSRDQST
jgi:predicted enzyme related to lactoylglutathione lyase